MVGVVDLEVVLAESWDDEDEEGGGLVWELEDVLSNPTLVVNEVANVSETRELEVEVDAPKGLYVWGVTEVGTYTGSSKAV